MDVDAVHPFQTPPLGYLFVTTETPCYQCGAAVRIVTMYGLIYADPRWPGATTMLEVDCPNCGKQEQPGTVIDMPPRSQREIPGF
jgi:hypothetical protein